MPRNQFGSNEMLNAKLCTTNAQKAEALRTSNSYDIGSLTQLLVPKLPETTTTIASAIEFLASPRFCSTS